MYVAKLSLICLVAFAFIVGCGMLNKQAEMPEATTAATEGEMMKADAPEAAEAAEAMTEATIQEITLDVTGMT